MIYIHAVRKVSFYVMSVFYFVAGMNHFWHPAFYLKIMPSWIGFHEALVMISGGFEILFAMLLLPNRTRRLAAWAIIFLLIGVFPANIQMMLDYSHEHDPKLWVAITRLPVQILLVWWGVYFYKEVIS